MVMEKSKINTFKLPECTSVKPIKRLHLCILIFPNIAIHHLNEHCPDVFATLTAKLKIGYH